MNPGTEGGNKSILLGQKKLGFGTGLWQHSFAGKIERGESPEQAAARELQEESGLVCQPKDLVLVGVFHYDFVNKEDCKYLMEVHIFTPIRVSGVPRESVEMRPQLFAIQDIPYEFMWRDNQYWLPSLLQSESWPPADAIKAHFLYENLREIRSWSVTYHGRQQQ